MNNNKLNTGWKSWDTYLQKFVGKRLNIMEIGAYKGDATCWFLNNLCKNHNSIVVAIDTWEGSPEYGDSDFSIVEKEFDENIKKTGRGNQVIKMKMTSKDGLIKLKQKGTVNYIFDIIYIDASHEAKDVLTDAILSWDLLDTGGIIIFDDYEWDKLSKEYFRPKIAIDSFISIFKPQLKVIFKKYQLMIEKISENDYEKPELAPYYKLTDEINRYKLNFIYFEFDDVNDEKLEYDLKISKNMDMESIDKLKKLNFDDIIYYDNLLYEKYKFNYNFTNAIYSIKDYKKTYDFIMSKNKHSALNDISILNKIEKILSFGISTEYIEIINIIDHKKLYNFKNNYVILNFTKTKTNTSCYNIVKYINKKFNINNKQCYNVNSNNNNYIDDKCYNIEFKINKYEDFENFISKIENKIDIIILDFKYGITFPLLNIMDENNNMVYLFFSVLLSLNIQNIDGCCVFPTFVIYSKISFQILWILKKYYKKISFTEYVAGSTISYRTKIIASGFLGINKNDLNEINNIGKNILKNNININYNKNINYLNNILNINNGRKKYEIFEKEISKYNSQKYNNILKNYILYKNILSFLKDDKYKNNKIENEIYIKQFLLLFDWYLIFIK